MGIEGLDDDKTAQIRYSNYTINFDGFDGCDTDLTSYEIKDTQKKDNDTEFEFRNEEANSTGYIRIGFSESLIVAANMESPDDKDIKLELYFQDEPFIGKYLHPSEPKGRRLTEAEESLFTWHTVSIDANSIALQLKFKHPEEISNQIQSPDFITFSVVRFRWLKLRGQDRYVPQG